MNFSQSLTRKFLIVIALMGFMVAAILLGKGSRNDADTVSPCDLNSGACQVLLDNHKALFALQYPPLVSLKTQMITVDTSGLDVDEIRMIVEGRDMYMGVLSYALQNDGSKWIGNFSIPVCAVDREMVWQFRFEFKYQQTITHSVVLHVKGTHT